MLTFSCPACQLRLRSDVSRSGTLTSCPECKHVFEVPKPPLALPADHHTSTPLPKTGLKDARVNRPRIEDFFIVCSGTLFVIGAIFVISCAFVRPYKYDSMYNLIIDQVAMNDRVVGALCGGMCVIAGFFLLVLLGLNRLLRAKQR